MNHIATMRQHTIQRISASTAFAIALVAPAYAGPGHDHGDVRAPAAGAGAPRFEAVSELFELVGILEGNRLKLYLDRTDDNRPVEGAQLEIEFGGMRLPLTDRGGGVFETEFDKSPSAGVTTVTATVIVGSESDLLVGELDLQTKTPTGEANETTWVERYSRPAGLWAAALAGLAVVIAIARRLARRVRTGAAS